MATTRLDLGPLTTEAWSPPAFCDTVVALCLTCDLGWRGQVCNNGTVSDEQACWPPRTSGVPPTSSALAGWGVYSPGITCPSGFTAVASATHGGASNFAFQFPLSEGETAIGCCPTGGYYGFIDRRQRQTCTLVRTEGQLTLATCVPDDLPILREFTLPQNLQSAVVETFTIYAPFFQAVWKSSDMPETSTSAPPSSSPSTTLPLSTETASSTPEEPSGLSTAAKAGIGIGAGLGAILLFVVAFLLWRVRYRKRKPARVELPGHEARFSELYAKHGESELGDQYKASLPSPDGRASVIEVNPQRPVELDPRDIR